MLQNYLHLILTFLLSSTSNNTDLSAVPWGLHEYTLQDFWAPSLFSYFPFLFLFFFFFFWPQQKVSGLKEHLVWSTLSLHIWNKIHQPGCLQELSKAYKDRGGEMQPCASLPLLLACNTRRAKNNSHALSSFFTRFLLRWTPADSQSSTPAGILP